MVGTAVHGQLACWLPHCRPRRPLEPEVKEEEGKMLKHFYENVGENILQKCWI
jgi:hypothetical protein